MVEGVKLAAPSGCSLVAPTGVTVDSSGATWYSYRVNGYSVSQVVPPPLFDPSKASDSQLEEYDFPVTAIRAATPQGARLRALLSKPAKVEIGVASCPNAPINAQPQQYNMPTVGPDAYRGYIPSSDWSGITTVPQGNPYYQPYQAAFGSYNQAAYQECNTNASASTWVGLGGVNGPPLLQAGTTSTNALPAFKFAEFVGLNGQDIGIPGPTIAAPGDNIVPSIQWVANYPYGDVYSDVWNTTTNVHWFAHMSLPEAAFDPNFGTSGATADFIDERPSSPRTRTPDPLAEPTFRYVSWLYLDAEQLNGLFTSYPNFDTFSILMIQGSNILMYPSDTGSGINNNWNMCGSQGF